MARIVPNYSALGKRNDLRVTLSSSRNAVSFSSPRTTKRFPSSRCASAIHIVCPLESTPETQPQLPTRFAEIVSDDFPVLHAPRVLGIIVCRRHTCRLLWRSVCSKGNFCTHSTDQSGNLACINGVSCQFFGLALHFERGHFPQAETLM
jgi:hypothetical protein